MTKLFFFVLLAFSFVFGEEILPYNKHYLSLVSQNDGYVNPWIDEYYTAGNALIYASSEGKWLGLSGLHSFSFTLAQSIYAPKAKFALQAPKDDHPYAGLLSLSFALHRREKDMLESLALRLGVSGKWSFGQEVQNGVHQLLGVGEAKGWETQISNELILNLYYERTHRYTLCTNGVECDVLPNVELAFGNANIYAKADVIFRLGYHLGSSFLSQGLIGENGGLQTGRVYTDGFGAFVFVGIGGAYVARKMAIEGNLFGRDFYPRNLRLIPWVGNLQTGVSLVSGILSVGYKILWVSKEFMEQKSSHLIGSVTLSLSF